MAKKQTNKEQNICVTFTSFGLKELNTCTSVSCMSLKLHGNSWSQTVVHTLTCQPVSPLYAVCLPYGAIDFAPWVWNLQVTHIHKGTLSTTEAPTFFNEGMKDNVLPLSASHKNCILLWVVHIIWYMVINVMCLSVYPCVWVYMTWRFHTQEVVVNVQQSHLLYLATSIALNNKMEVIWLWCVCIAVSIYGSDNDWWV